MQYLYNIKLFKSMFEGHVSFSQHSPFNPTWLHLHLTQFSIHEATLIMIQNVLKNAEVVAAVV